MKQLAIPLKFMGGDGTCSDSVLRLVRSEMSDGQVICTEAGGVEPSQEKGMAISAWRTKSASVSRCGRTRLIRRMR